QGSMSVMEYEARFVELEEFAPYICDNEKRRVRKFGCGLKGYIRSRILAQDCQTFASAVRAAWLQEVEQKMYFVEKLSQESIPVPFARQNRKKKRRLSSDVISSAVPSAAVPATPVTSPKVKCPHCGKRHGGGCW